ncbi:MULTISPECIES: DUF3099 domain-containing protein [unclassified Nocardioides]|jgi:hypothetical protein|uniref:DUF3099 domain-containing protein n=1 Tax=unclassified Nocardioides TaxID=2615069 RepID=UPI000702C007|nr:MULTISPECIES: DUF3099 domain-containing protein [unclassified Nocardioides]KRC50281.1 hypothetical protein ASE19_16940 [Nocardioides sp. Root79]KRC75749.1 hypothetical protein ASE20_22960 [Nocardioides sp. Root240]
MSSSRHGRSEPEAIRITTAGSDPQADIARRQKKYAIAMTIRTLCFIGAAITGAAGWNWVWPFLILASLFLPYVAVVLANANDSRSLDLPLTGGGGDAQRQLGPGVAPADGSDD